MIDDEARIIGVVVRRKCDIVEEGWVDVGR